MSHALRVFPSSLAFRCSDTPYRKVRASSLETGNMPRCPECKWFFPKEIERTYAGRPESATKRQPRRVRSRAARSCSRARCLPTSPSRVRRAEASAWSASLAKSRVNDQAALRSFATHGECRRTILSCSRDSPFVCAPLPLEELPRQHGRLAAKRVRLEPTRIRKRR